MLDRDGEIWDAANTSFPVTQKLFWWSSNWAGMREDQEPALTVVATRLDGLDRLPRLRTGSGRRAVARRKPGCLAARSGPKAIRVLIRVQTANLMG